MIKCCVIRWLFWWFVTVLLLSCLCNALHIPVVRHRSSATSYTVLSPPIQQQTLAYRGSINVGGQQVVLRNILFDSGSSKMWVMGIRALRDNRTVHYDCSMSASCIRINDSAWSIEYTDGQMASGYSDVVDTVVLANFSPVSVQFGVADVYSGELVLDGVVGLGMNVDSQAPPTLLEAMKAAGQISSRTFSFSLSSSSASGHLILGDIDGTLAPNGLNNYSLVGLTSKTSWTLLMNGVFVNDKEVTKDIGKSVETMCSPCQVLFDSGTSAMSMPVPVFLNVVERINKKRSDCSSSGDNKVVCHDASKGTKGLPNIGFVFTSGHPDKASKERYVLTPDEYAIPYNCNGEQCSQLLEIQASNGGYVLGDVFLQRHYTVFDADSLHIAIASSIELTSITTGMVFATLALTMGVIGLPLGVVFFKHRREERLTLERGHQLSNLPEPDMP